MVASTALDRKCLQMDPYIAFYGIKMRTRILREVETTAKPITNG